MLATDIPIFAAKACCASYISEWRCMEEMREEFADIAVYTTPGAYAFIGRNEQQTILVFRGSDQCRDLLGGAFSLGFRWHAIYHGMFERVWRQINPQYLAVPDLTITGHSQGGAFALFASLLVGKGRCITFGCPAVFGQQTLRQYNVPTTRYVHGNDIVPSLFPGYLHAGKLVSLRGNGGKIEDHKIINYLKALHAQLH